METSVGAYLLRWRVLRIFSVTWLLLTLVFITIFLPPNLLLIGILGSLFGVSFGTMAVVGGRRTWSIIPLFDAGMMFFVLLFIQAISKTVEENLPIMLLQFVMLLYTVELLTVTFKHHNLFSNENLRSEALVSTSALTRSAEQALRQMARLGLLFASCYFVSLGILYIGTFVTAITPVLADVSLYVVVVSVSLALLILLRED